MKLAVFGKHDDNTLAQMVAVAERANHAALLPDGHLGYIMPIGGVAAYKNEVSVVGVGFDIGCGNTAYKTDLKVEQLGDRDALADALYPTLSFGVGSKSTLLGLRYEDWVRTARFLGLWEHLNHLQAPTKDLQTKAEEQFGSIGAGNHYVDIFTDEEGYVWVGAHFGSRGLGHTIASGFLALGQGRPWGERVPEQECIFSLDHPFGGAYWACMTAAGAYAKAARHAVVEHVVSYLGGEILDTVNNHHNYAWEETHFGEEFVVVRKGSTPAFPNQRGFVGGSMGDNAVILRGKTPEEMVGGGREQYDQKQAMFSTVHGAGRTMSRSAAKGKWKNGVCIKPGEVNHLDMRTWLNEKNVVLRGGDLDEAPQAYRRLSAVLEDAPGVTVEHVLTPRIVMMAAGNIVDPYKD